MVVSLIKVMRHCMHFCCCISSKNGNAICLTPFTEYGIKAIIQCMYTCKFEFGPSSHETTVCIVGVSVML